MLKELLLQRASSNPAVYSHPRLTVDFISLPPEKAESHTPLQASSPTRATPGNRPKSTLHSLPDHTQNTIRPPPSTPESKTPDHSDRPALDMVKLLKDLRDVAKKTAERASEANLDRRKPSIPAENLKAPESQPTEITENYTMADGYQRVCKIKANGKKQCMRKEADDDSIWNAKIFLAEQPAESNSAEELSMHLQRALGKH